jgi:predicted Fe-Mo cluster-binding NifX family protein
MKIAVCAKGTDIKTEVDDRFGRCENFVIVDTETKEVEAIENEAKNDAGGAGGKAVRILALRKVEAVIAPELGPKAATAIKAFDMKAYSLGKIKTVEDAMKAYEAGELKEMDNATVKEHSGLRRV